MEERIMEFDVGAYVETENTVEGNTIYFSILDESIDSVHWIIGTDPRVRKENNIEIFFKEPFGDIEIRCIAFKSAVLSCLGNDGIIDTVYKTLHVGSWWEVPYLGEFQGKSTLEPNVVFSMEIDTMTYYSGFGGVQNGRSAITFLTNFPNGYQMAIPPDGVNLPNQPYTKFSYNGFITGSDEELFISIALFDVKTNEIRIDYSFFTGSKYELFTYKGQKQ
jgi:hypothetical protein